jgi:hypothetical protein
MTADWDLPFCPLYSEQTDRLHTALPASMNNSILRYAFHWDSAKFALHRGMNMKSSTFPSLRIAPELRRAAEDVLKNGETLSSFVEHSIRLNIERRYSQNEFVAYGLTSRTAAKRTGEYYPASEVMDEVGDMLAKAEARTKQRKT